MAPNMPKNEAEDILLCASCDPVKGRAACKRDFNRLRQSEAEVAKYIEAVHVPRCMKP